MFFSWHAAKFDFYWPDKLLFLVSYITIISMEKFMIMMKIKWKKYRPYKINDK